MIRGAIFDLDGTLLDSNPYWNKAPNAYLASVGKQGRETLDREIFHMTLPQAAEYMIAEFGLTQSPEEIVDGVNAAIRRYYLEEIPGTMRKGQCREYGPHSGPTAQYRYDSKAHAAMVRAMEKQRTKIDFGGYRKDTRAQYLEPWRES